MISSLINGERRKKLQLLLQDRSWPEKTKEKVPA
jgi:hypothetical protein